MCAAASYAQLQRSVAVFDRHPPAGVVLDLKSDGQIRRALDGELQADRSILLHLSRGDRPRNRQSAAG
jgi:hypothetical protein